MSDNEKKYYITTPIYYVNDLPHIGHVYTSVACDVLARFKRLDGYSVHFLSGTDEHGQKVSEKAAEMGVPTQEYTDKISDSFRGMSKVFLFSNDDFIRTTEKRHQTSAQHLWNRMVENDQIYLGSYSGWYAVRDEAYYTESELVKGDDGQLYNPTSGAAVEWVEEPSYFFKLSEWQAPLLKFYDENPNFIAPASRRNEVLSFVKGGLNDLSVSRTTFDWGVPVPDADGHVMYVWVDALTNYITALGYPETDSEMFKNYWPADMHMVGKDILRFHAVYWPAMLMAAKLQPPKRVYAHGWWTNEGQKISKSLGNVIDPFELEKTFGVDALRYFLMREVPFGQDGDFSRDAMIRRCNTDLSNDFGNLAQRVLSMIQRNCEATVPESSSYSSADMELLQKAHTLIESIRPLLDQQAFDKALRLIWSLIAEGNKYIDAQAPWTLKKTDTERMKTVLATLVELLRCVAILTLPFTPTASEQLLDQLAIPEENRTFEHLVLKYSLEPGTLLPVPSGLFPRYVEEAA